MAFVKRIGFLLFIFGLFSCTFFRAEEVVVQQGYAADEAARCALTKKTLDHLCELDSTLALLAGKVEGNVLVCADSTEFLERVDFLRNLIGQIVFCVERPADKKSLQFLCALSTTMLECIEWLSRGGDTVGAALDLTKIKVDNFPEEIGALDQMIDANVLRCRGLAATIQAMSVGFFTRMFRGAKNVACFVAKYTIQSKVFAGVGLAGVGLWLLAQARAKKEAEIEPGSYALTHRNKYGKHEITDKNLYQYAPKVPSTLDRQLSAWFQENNDAWKTFVEQSVSSTNLVDSLIKKRVAIFEMLRHKKQLDVFPSKGGNIIFKFPADPEWLLKISGPENRLRLQGANQDKEYRRFDLIDPTNMVPTHQTASRAFHGLKLKEAIAVYKLDEIEAVEDYLWSPQKRYEDECCVVAEKFLKNIKLLCDCSPEELDALLTEKKIGQVALAAYHAGLWNLAGDNLAVNVENGKVVFFDAEQPNTTKPSQEFNKDEGRFLHNTRSGLEALYQTLPQGSKARDHVESWVRSKSEILGKGNEAKNLRQLFDENNKVKQESLKQAQKKEKK